MIETQKAFSALSEEYVERTFQFDPVAATRSGIHDYDRRFPDDTPDGFRERSLWLRDLDQRLVASVPWEELPIEQRVDYALLRSRLAIERSRLDEVKLHTRNPARYPETALGGIFLLLARPFAPLEERKELVLERLMAVPAYLDAARANLLQVPPLLREIASEINLGGLAYVDDVMRTLLRSFPGEAERIEHAGSTARLGFLRYQEFLERDLPAKAGGSFALGERWMNYELERGHLLAMNCEALAAWGREQVALLQSELEVQAKRIDPSRTWREQLEESRRRHPEPLRVREAYVAEMERARRFVLERGLAPMPNCPLEIVDTPHFDRVLTPYASYLPPAPFDVEQSGTLFVTPVDLARGREHVDAHVGGHSYASITLIAVHEGYPGHHLQLANASRTGSRLRRLHASPVFSEGWALYSEELMRDEGFFLDAHVPLVLLRNLLWRACRVVLDVELQRERMSFTEAVDWLVEQVMLDRASAEMEVKRYVLTPGEPLGYMVGRWLLNEIRDEARAALGARFELGAFHAALLQSGTIPLSLAREEVLSRLGVPAEA